MPYVTRSEKIDHLKEILKRR